MIGSKIVGVIEERISKKTGNKYTCIVIKLSDTYEKVVLLKNLELEVLKASNNK